MSDFHRCKKCLMVSTRPRITFNEKGVCNACQWAEAKKTVNWEERQEQFKRICDSFYKSSLECDCIVPWSGGKDSIYVAHKMLDFGMRPLLLTILPHLETKVGCWNRHNMRDGFEYLEVELPDVEYRLMAKQQFIHHGRPKHPWENAISAVVLQQAVELNIPFVIYGEEGEQEYGGVSRETDRWMKPVDKEYLMKYYYCGQPCYDLPCDEDFGKLFFTQWSRFENWSPTKHGEFAVGKGMKADSTGDTWQISDKLQPLHMHMAFLKYGFGSYVADMSIHIRDGTMSRAEAAVGAELFDGIPPVKWLPEYLTYFNMTEREYNEVLDSHANRDILEHNGVMWRLKDLAL